MPVIRFTGHDLDLDRLELHRNGEVIPLTARSAKLLAYFLRNPGRVISQAELLENVWGATTMSAATVPTTVAALRKALNDSASQPRFLRTVRGAGYEFLSDARRGNPSAPPQLPDDVVGRSSELAILLDLAGNLQDGATLVLLTGDPGIGKTTLLHHFSSAAKDLGLRVAAGSCPETPGALPLWPWSQILRAQLGNNEAQQRDLMTAALDLSSSYSSPTPHTSAAQARFLAFTKIARLLREQSLAQPLALLIDDLHKSDTATLLLVEFLLSDAASCPILVLAAYRDTEIQGETNSRILRRLSTSSRARTIHLTPLSLASVRSLLERATPHSDKLAPLILDRSGGNPLFVKHLLALLGPNGDLPSTIPEGIRDAVLQQIGDLEESAKTALAAAAVIGREFSLIKLAAVLDLEPRNVLPQLDVAMSKRLVVEVRDPPGFYRFSHVLLRDALYENLSAARKTEIHLRVANASERIYNGDSSEPASVLAHHFFQAAHIGGAEKALQYSLLAADAANRRLALEEVPHHFRTALAALRLTPKSNLRSNCMLMVELGEAELRSGDRSQGRNTLLDAAALARRAKAPDLLARASLGIAPGPFAIEVGVYDPVLMALLEESLAATPRTDCKLRAQLLSRLAMALVWANAEGRRSDLSNEAIELARETGDPRTQVLALLARHGVIGGPRFLAERLSIADQMRALADASGDTSLVLMRRLLRITGLLEHGDCRALGTEVEVFAHEARATKLPHFIWYVDLFKAMQTLMRGEYGEARRLAGRFLETGRLVDDENATHSFAAHSVIQSWERGEADAAASLAQRFCETFPLVPGWRAALALFLFESGAVDDARRLFERLASNRFEDIPRNEVWTTTVVVLAEVCASIGDRARAHRLYDMLQEGERQVASLGFGVASLGAVARYLGILSMTLERWNQALRHFDRAISIDRKMGAVPWLLRARFDCARALIMRNAPGDAMNARGLANEVAQRAGNLGMIGLAARANRLRQP